MYAGLSMTKFSGRVMGAHQQIDRICRRQLDLLLPAGHNFPQFKEIMKFEGKNGPDAIKIKSPGRDEPWHFLNPLDKDNSEYMKMIRTHYDLLAKNLKQNNQERAAFEAAWLAHAVVDGLTPAHHYPYEAKIQELRAGKPKESRNSVAEKMIFKGENAIGTIGNMYKVYGPRGLYTAHHLFEFGVMLLLRPLRLGAKLPHEKHMKDFEKYGPEQYFINSAREVVALDLYEEYLAKGWTSVLSNKIRHSLAPILTDTVTILWYGAAKEAGLVK